MERPDGHEPPGWDVVSPPTANRDIDKVRGANLALATLKAHWTEVIDTATVLLESGSVALSAAGATSPGSPPAGDHERGPSREMGRPDGRGPSGASGSGGLGSNRLQIETSAGRRDVVVHRRSE